MVLSPGGNAIRHSPALPTDLLEKRIEWLDCSAQPCSHVWLFVTPHGPSSLPGMLKFHVHTSDIIHFLWSPPFSIKLFSGGACWASRWVNSSRCWGRYTLPARAPPCLLLGFFLVVSWVISFILNCKHRCEFPELWAILKGPRGYETSDFYKAKGREAVAFVRIGLARLDHQWTARGSSIF